MDTTCSTAASCCSSSPTSCCSCRAAAACASRGPTLPRRRRQPRLAWPRGRPRRRARPRLPLARQADPGRGRAGRRLVRRRGGPAPRSRLAGRSPTARPTRPTLPAWSRIGADVPFFAAAVPAARVTGVGERVEPLPAGDHARRARPPAVRPVDRRRLRRAAAGRVGDGSRTTCWQPARRLRPELDDVLAAVERAAGGDPQLTGSGPTVYHAQRRPGACRAPSPRGINDGGIRATRDADAGAQPLASSASARRSE